jgi:LmbE family N-acetylglucosaminyl deacetylase
MSPAGTARRIARAMLLRSAHDVTATLATRSALIVAPHPDDETLGCAARILAAKRAGAVVTVVVATDGSGSHEGVGADPAAIRELRRAELAEATRRLGLPASDVIELGHPDGELSDRIDRLSNDLAAVIRQRQPADVYVTCAAEWHPDHAAAAVAARRAVGSGPAPRLLEYPIWLWSDWPVSRRHRRDGMGQFAAILLRRAVEVVSISAADRTSKQDALGAYASQTGGGESAVAGGVALPSDVLDRALNGPELFFRVRPKR